MNYNIIKDIKTNSVLFTTSKTPKELKDYLKKDIIKNINNLDNYIIKGLDDIDIYNSFDIDNSYNENIISIWGDDGSIELEIINIKDIKTI
tara:strand:+ start:76 stop:348 length:273 start_codon:yes stop_codon:yes gene_type:complete